MSACGPDVCRQCRQQLLPPQRLKTGCSFSTLFTSICQFWLRTLQSPKGCFLAAPPGSGHPHQPQSLPLLLVLFQAAHRGPLRPAKAMKDASIAPLTAGQLQKGPQTACAEMGITGPMLILSTCHAPVCELEATGAGGTARGWERRCSSAKGICLSGVLEESRGLRSPCPEEPCRHGAFFPWDSLCLQTLHVQGGQELGLFCAVLGSGMTSL